MVNKAITAHGKRQETSLAKLIADQLAQFGETLKPKPEEGADKAKGLESQIADLRKMYERSEKLRQEAEGSARRERTNAQLKAALEGAGARKEALDVLVTAWGASGVLRYDEQGNPSLAVKRSRGKGAPAEELVFDDFGQGVADWAKSQEASVFLAPPVTTQPPAQRSTNGQSTPPRYAEAPVSEEEKARRTLEMLEGVGLNALGNPTG
jgi:hypothetical protein